jgi:hypothetical protein
MSFDKIVESLIKEAQERGEFDNLPGKGKPIDLTSYFETPEEVRLAQSILKNAGMTSPEVQILKEIASSAGCTRLSPMRQKNRKSEDRSRRSRSSST